MNADRPRRLWRWADGVVQRFLLRSGTTKLWTWQKAERSTLARYVSVACAAEEFGPLGLIDGRTVNDVREGPGGPAAVAEAAFDLLASAEIRYDMEGYTDAGENAQRIRTPTEMRDRRIGTCLDLALLYAGYLMHLHLRPLVIVLEGHAMVAVTASRFSLAVDGVQDEAAQLNKWIEDGTIIPVECTAMAVGDGVTAGFEDAVATGAERIKNGSLRFFIDPWHLQKNRGLRPYHCHKVSPAKVGVLGTATAAIAAGATVALWPAPELITMPASDGRNIALFPLQTLGDAAPIEGETVAEELALTLRSAFADAGELRTETTPGWSVWGPSDLETSDAPPVESSDFEAAMRERNADIGVFGTIESVDGRRFPQISIWFRPSARGVKEAGVTGGVLLAGDDIGTTASLSRLAADLSSNSDAWFQLLHGVGLLHDAETRTDLLAIRELFVEAAESTSGDTRALAQLLTGGAHLYIDATLGPDDDAARVANGQLASAPLRQVLNSESTSAGALRARAALGLAQTELNAGGCDPENPSPENIDEAERLLSVAASTPTDLTTPARSELVFRRRVMEGRIEFCRWHGGTGGQASADRAVEVLSAAIDEYRSRTDPEERARVRFHTSDAYGLRGQVVAEREPNRAFADLVAAFCLARPFSQSYWVAQREQLEASGNLDGQSEVSCRALVN